MALDAKHGRDYLVFLFVFLIVVVVVVFVLLRRRRFLAVLVAVIPNPSLANASRSDARASKLATVSQVNGWDRKGMVSKEDASVSRHASQLS